MNVIGSTVPLYAVLVSFILPVFLVLSRKNPNRREQWTFVAGWIKLVLVLMMLPGILAGAAYEAVIIDVIPGVPIAFRVDAMGILFALVASFLWIVTTVYAIGYMRGLHEHSQTRFYAFFALSLSATLGVAFSANLFTLYLFYEMLSLSTYPLVTHHQDKEARAAGRKYLTYILGTSIGLVLPAMVIVYSYAGTLDFSSGGVLAESGIPSTVAGIALMMFVFGFAKSGLMPFHSWLPGAMVAPTPVSSLLHAVAVVKVGVFSILRVVSGIYGPEYTSGLFLGSVKVHVILAVIAGITVVMSSLIALSQDGLKRRLAFSTIGQLGYIVLGALLLTPQALAGSLLHIVMHAFGKITLFFCAGAIYVQTGKKYISQLNGIGWKMPFTMAAFFLGSLSVVGMPPAGGFISKWYLVTGAFASEQRPFMICYLLSSLLGAAYLFPIVFRAFFYSEPENDVIEEAPLCCVAPLVVTGLISIAIFFFPGVFADLAQRAVSGVFGN